MNAYRFIRSLASVRRPSLAAIGVLVVASSALAQVPAKMYVDGGISASGDGSNWGQAFKTLDEALANQLSGGAIWVSKGHTYNANLATNYTTGFLITLPFQIYGGLTVSTGTLASRTAADMASTLLEGGFDTGSTYTAYHVINIQELKGDTVVIDGFTIHGGDALNHGGLDGGGIYAPCANLRLANLTLDDNHAQNGGGLFAQGGCPYDVSPPDLVTLYPRTLNITNCKFIHNVVDGVGGGMFGDQVYGQVVNVTFFDNHGPNHGGGVYLWNMGTGNNLEFTSCAFDKNFITTNASGGGGGISVSETTATPPVGGNATLVNCTFAQNYSSINSSSGAALEMSTHSQCTVVNSIFWKNWTSPPGFLPPISGSPTVNDSDVEGGWTSPGGSNIHNATPQFTTLTNILDEALFDDLTLSTDASVCVDAADWDARPHDDFDLDKDGNLTELVPLDILLNPRTFDNSQGVSHGGHGTRKYLDMGAYERQ